MGKFLKTERGKLAAWSRARSRKRPRWTREEVDVLRRLYRTRSNLEIARRLRRTLSSVVFKGFHLGLSKGMNRLREMGRENIRQRWHSRQQRVAHA